MKPALLTVCLFLLYNVTTAQNYYVASTNGAVYYQNKLLKKKDKVTPKGNIRFKKSDGYVKLSGPGGLYTLSADKARPTGNEFLLTLSNELFPPLRLVSTVRPSLAMHFSPGVLHLWNFQGGAYRFFDGTALPVDPAFTSEEQIIGFLHETDSGLVFQRAKIQKDSLLLIRAKDFNWGSKNKPAPSINHTLILQVAQAAVLDTLLTKYKTLAPILETVAALETDDTPLQKAPPAYQILDALGSAGFINKRKFVKDMRFHIQKTDAHSQGEFLEAYEFNDYITETYGYWGTIYQLEQVLADELGLPSDFF